MIPTLDSSEFDKRSAEFGYVFPDPKLPNYWENGQWNMYSAIIKSHQLNTEAQLYTRLSAFQLADVAGLTGKSFDDLIQKAPTSDQLLITSDERIQDYVEYQLSLPDH